MGIQEKKEIFILSCPFCEFEDSDSEFLGQHVAYCHPEDPSAASRPTHTHQDWVAGEEELHAAQADEPLAVLDNSEGLYIPCPHGCGEEVAKTELQLHVDLHVAESVALDEIGDLHLRSVDDGGYAAARMKVVDHTNDECDDNDDSDLHQDDSVAHERDIVLKGKNTDNRRRRKKDVTKSSQDVQNGIKRLGVRLS